MKKNSALLLSLLAALNLISCTRKTEEEMLRDKKVVDMKSFEEDVTTPSELYNEMLKLHKPLALEPTAGEGKDKDKEKEEGGGQRSMLKTKPPIEQVPFKVFLIEKTKGVLGNTNLELQYPAGGGFLDYKTFLQSPAPGYFLLDVQFGPEMDPKDFHVFYLSHARVRQIGGKTVGNGCGRYYDITKFWQDSAKNGGIELYTGDNRHISLTAGIFFFVTPFRGKLRMAHLTIKDSRYKDLECVKEKDSF